MSEAKGQQHEPSMEEILASIRRIIADEEPAKDTTEDTTERRHESVPAAREGAALLPDGVKFRFDLGRPIGFIEHRALL